MHGYGVSHVLRYVCAGPHKSKITGKSHTPFRVAVDVTARFEVSATLPLAARIVAKAIMEWLTFFTTTPFMFLCARNECRRFTWMEWCAARKRFNGIAYGPCVCGWNAITWCPIISGRIKVTTWRPLTLHKENWKIAAWNYWRFDGIVSQRILVDSWQIGWPSFCSWPPFCSRAFDRRGVNFSRS